MPAIGLLLPVVLVGASLAGAREPALPEFEPDLERAGDLTLRGSTWTHEAPEHTMLLRQVEDDDRLRYIEGRTGVSIDPFATPPGRSSRYLSYLLVIENKGEKAVGFNALGCWLKTNREEILTPIGLTDLSFDYQLAGLELPASYERISPALLEGALTIGPNESISGLLIYHAADPKTKRYQIDLDLIPPSGDIIRVRVPYRRISEDKNKSRKKKQPEDER
jgi:hypothetical protein